MAVLIGTTTTGGGGDFFNAGDVNASSFAAVADGSVETLTIVIIASGFSTLQCGIYADSAGSPGARLGTTGTTSSATAGNKVLTLGVPVSVVSGTTYWLAALPLGGSLDITATTGGTYKGHTGETALQNPFGSVAFTDATKRVPILGEGTLGAAAAQVNTPRFQAIPFMR